MNNSGDHDDTDLSKLSLEEKLVSKIWKARSAGYQELDQKFKSTISNDEEHDNSTLIYWKDPSRFGDFVTDSNVVAQEQAILALESFLLNVDLPKHVELKTVMSNWVPALVEKGLASSRAVTKSKAMECVTLLCSFDESITETVQLVLPFFSKKLPKLVAASVNCIKELVSSFGFVNVPLNELLPEILEPLARLAGHADRNVRAGTMSLIVEIYKTNRNNKPLLQELLLNKLKPIQQNDLEKLFNQADAKIDVPNDSIRLFKWQQIQSEIDSKERGQYADEQIDKDGDTLMEVNVGKINNDGPNMDPFNFFLEETILDKLPSDFYHNVESTKWKDRVEALQDFCDNVLSKAKRLKAERQNYTELLSVYGQIIQNDANLQAVTLAAQSVEKICEKLRLPGFSKHYATLVFVPLLNRTKEKKPSVIDPIRQALQCICRFYNPINSEGNNEDLLQEILQFMKHKIPQIRMETTGLFTFLLQELPVSKDVISRNLEDEIIPTVSKIVNDTQPTIRNVGFECFAQILKTMGKTQVMITALEKLDNLKRKKIEAFCSELPKSGTETTPRGLNRNSGDLLKGEIRPSNSSSIPSKRVASSPLKKVTKTNSPNVQKSRMLLTSRSLTMPASPSSTPLSNSSNTNNSNNNNSDHELHSKLQRFTTERQSWIKERHQLLSQINDLTTAQNRITNENEMLREQLKGLQTDIHEKGLQLRSKDLQLNKLQDKVALLEKQAHDKQKSHLSSSEPSTISTNLGVRSVSSSSFEPMTTRTKHVRTPSESSDDLPRRVDSLQLDHNANDIINEESWKRAAEVTSQLKARIERMRAKTKGIGNNP